MENVLDLVDLVLLIERGPLDPAEVRAALAATFDFVRVDLYEADGQMRDNEETYNHSSKVGKVSYSCLLA